MNIELKDIHIGQKIKERLAELQMTKSEFGRLIGVPQQHINRILERDTMETKKLVKICQVLDYNFFAYFCHFPTNVNAYLAAVALGEGNAQNNVGDTAMIAENELLKEKVRGLEETREHLKAQIELLKSQIVDKEKIIQLVSNK